MNPRTASVMAPALVAAALLTAVGTLLEQPPGRRARVPSGPSGFPVPSADQMGTGSSAPGTTVAAEPAVDPAAIADPWAPPASPLARGGELVSVTLSAPVQNRPPDCAAVAASTSRLWPSDHELQPVVLSGATDPDGHPVSLAVTSVTQDEPIDGTGDGSTSPDAALTASPSEVLVRAERSGNGDGRVYQLSFAATDPRGGTCGGVTSVVVPLKKNSVAEHSGEEFNSLVP